VHQLADEEMIEVTAGKTRGIRLVDRGEELSEADVLLRLVAMGWTSARGTRPGPPADRAAGVTQLLLQALTTKGLPEPLDLDFDPGEDGEGEGTGGHQAESSAGARAARAPAADGRAPGGEPRWHGPASTLSSPPPNARCARAAPSCSSNWKHKNEGTPETHERASRRNQGALARLYQSGAIDAEQLAAAVEIALVHERIGSDVAVKTASLETRVDVTRIGDGGFYERLGQVRREMAYTRGDRSCRAARPVLDMIAGEQRPGSPSPRAATGCTTARRKAADRRARPVADDPRRGVQGVDEKSRCAAHAGWRRERPNSR
jgi:hypothetical protein